MADTGAKRSEPDHVWMVCNNCGHVDSGPAGAMYECPSCGWGDGWGAESHVEAKKREAQIVERGRFYAD